MPIFQIDVEKRLGTEFWSNVYLVEVSAPAGATPIATQIISAEHAIHADVVTFTRYRLSSLTENDDFYQIVTMGFSGSRDISTSLLPLFNTLRVDFTPSSGRPSRKFYRGVLTEGDIDGDAVNTAAFSVYPGLISLAFADVETPGLVDPQGTFFSSAVLHPFVQMRQLRRSRRRRINGGGIFQ